MKRQAVRIEHDLLGDRAVPDKVYYGVHTLRAFENFPITGTPISIYPDLVTALACVIGITANREYLLRTVDQSISIVTALNPHIGYERASAVAREAYAAGKTVREVVLEKKFLTAAQLDEVLQPELLTRPGYVPAMRIQADVSAPDLLAPRTRIERATYPLGGGCSIH